MEYVPSRDTFVDSFQSTLSKDESFEVTVICEGKQKIMTVQNKDMLGHFQKKGQLSSNSFSSGLIQELPADSKH